MNIKGYRLLHLRIGSGPGKPARRPWSSGRPTVGIPVLAQLTHGWRQSRPLQGTGGPLAVGAARPST